MSVIISWNKKRLFLICAVVGLILFTWFFYSTVTTTHRSSNQQTLRYSVWPEFESPSLVYNDIFKSKCPGVSPISSVRGLVDIRHQWSRSPEPTCRRHYLMFSSIFSLEHMTGSLSIPEPLLAKVKGWLSNSEDLLKDVSNQPHEFSVNYRSQEIIRIVNEFTREDSIFSPLRDKRPTTPPDQPERYYFDDLVKTTASTCDFCNFTNFTAEDFFGRLVSKHSFSASNIFKMDSLHAVMAMKKHDPLHWTHEEFLDLFRLTEAWLHKASRHSPRARYPSLIWDVLPRCGASQVHPHLQLLLSSDRHHGGIEAWRKAAEDYYRVFGSNYFTNLVAVHAALNLTVTLGSAIVFASLVPKGANEVVVMAREPSTDFYTLLFFVLRAFIDDFNRLCYSMGMGYPATNVVEGKLPIFARIITRGYVTDIRSDMSSFELFLTPNVNTDPYRTISVIRKSVERSANSMGINL